MAATLKSTGMDKEFDPDRITQHESKDTVIMDETYDYSNLDVYSRMYRRFPKFRNIWKDGSKPFLLVVLSQHVNGPGDFEDYFR